jgi:uncharacterized protein YbjT (DUF2867 family)
MNTNSSTPFRVLLAGATGAVGSEVMRQALADPRIAQVIAPTRRPLPRQAGLINPVVDFNQLPTDASWWQADAVICTLGTTIGKAGSQQAFAAIDRDLPVRIASLARQAGASRFALNSALGANPSGNFYLRTKAEAEEGIRKLDFPIYTIVRPSLIDAERIEVRLAERAGILLARAFAPLIPRRYRAVKPAAIAHALLAGVLRGDEGERIVESDELQD